MTIERDPVQEFLVAMGPVKEALGDFLRALYRRPEVKLATLYHPSAYMSSDFGISVDLKNGAIVDFWIELERKERLWEMTCYVARGDLDEDGSHRVAGFPVREIDSSRRLPSAILEAIGDLRIKSADDALFR